MLNRVAMDSEVLLRSDLAARCTWIRKIRDVLIQKGKWVKVGNWVSNPQDTTRIREDDNSKPLHWLLGGEGGGGAGRRCCSLSIYLPITRLWRNVKFFIRAFS